MPTGSRPAGRAAERGRGKAAVIGRRAALSLAPSAAPGQVPWDSPEIGVGCGLGGPITGTGPSGGFDHAEVRRLGTRAALRRVRPGLRLTPA